MMNPRFYSRYNTAMPEKSQNQAPGGDEGESMGDTPGELPGAGVAIRRHTDRCFHAIEEVVYDGPLTAPVAAGTVVGRLEVSLPDGRSQSVPLAAAETVERKGALGRAGAALARLIRGG